MPDIRAEAIDYLKSHQVMTLAVSADAGVWAAAVFYVNLDFSLFFLSAQHTRHARAIAESPWVAAAIQEDYSDWAMIKGIQLEGSVQLLAGAKRERAIAHYRAKYPFIGAAGGAIAASLAKVSWYEVSPTRLYYLDNSKGFGHREEVAVHS